MVAGGTSDVYDELGIYATSLHARLVGIDICANIRECWLKFQNRCFGDKGDVEDITEGLCSSALKGDARRDMLMHIT